DLVVPPVRDHLAVDRRWAGEQHQHDRDQCVPGGVSELQPRHGCCHRRDRPGDGDRGDRGLFHRRPASGDRVSAVLKNPGSTLLRAVVVLVLCVFAAFPVYWVINTATSTNEELYGSGQSVGLDLARLPQVFEALTMDGPLRWLANSAIVATGTTVLSLSMAVVVGYSISRFRYAGRGALSFALFTTQMMPE